MEAIAAACSRALAGSVIWRGSVDGGGGTRTLTTVLRSTDFHSPAAFATAKAGISRRRSRIGLSLYPRLHVRVAPVESLHLPKQLVCFGLAQDCLVCCQI